MSYHPGQPSPEVNPQTVMKLFEAAQFGVICYTATERSDFQAPDGGAPADATGANGNVQVSVSAWLDR